jgi:hypothetical protein
VNAEHRAIESFAERERYEMRIEWREVWTLFVGCDTCVILVSVR